MKIIAIRHFATHSNEAGLLQGHRDVSILEKSVDEEEVQKNLDTIETEMQCPELVVSSPLMRARETASIYGFENPVLDRRVAEYDFGEFTGRPKAEMVAYRDGAWLNRFQSVDWGEGFDSFSSRISAFIDDVMIRHQSVVLFTHGGVVRFLTGQFENGNLAEANQVHVDNNSLHVFEIN